MKTKMEDVSWAELSKIDFSTAMLPLGVMLKNAGDEKWLALDKAAWRCLYLLLTKEIELKRGEMTFKVRAVDDFTCFRQIAKFAEAAVRWYEENEVECREDPKPEEPWIP